MANVFVDLPVPIGNGAGASVAVDTMGEVKTVTYRGNLFASVQVQASADGVNWHTVHTFGATTQSAGDQTLKQRLNLGARFMRAFVSNFRAGTAANMDVGSNDNGSQIASPVAPAGNGSGASLSVATLGTFNSVYVSGAFSGAVILEVSDDGIDWVPCLSFNRNGGVKSKEFVAQFVRVTRNNVNLTAPGLPIVSVVAINDAQPAPPPPPPTGGAPNVLIYRQGAADTGPVVFGTWAGLIAQLAVLRAASNADGRYVIQFDDSITAPMTLPVGGPYDMTNVVWMGYPSIGQVIVDIDEGVTVSNLREFVNIRIDGRATVTPFDSSLGSGTEFTMFNSLITNRVGGSPAMFTGLGAGDVAVLEMDFSTLSGSTDPIFDVPVGATFAFLPASGSNIDNGSFAGAGTLLFLPGDGGGFIDFPQVNHTGSVLNILLITNYWDLPAVAVAPIPAADVIGPPSAMHRYDVSGGAIAQPLPAALNQYGRPSYHSEVSGTAGLTLVPAGADTINGVAAPFAVPAGGTVLINPDGVSNWFAVVVEDPTSAIAGAAPNSLIFRPGSGLTGPVIFDAWAALIARLGVLRAASNGGGVYQIGIDNSLAAATIPAGAYDMTNVELVGARPDSSTFALVTVADGATFTNLRTIRSIAVDYAGTSGGAVSDLATGDVFLLDFAQISVSGSREFFDIGAVSAVLQLRRGAVFATGAYEVLDKSGAGIAVLQLADGADVQADTLRGGGIVQGQFIVDSATLSGTQTNLTTLTGTQVNEPRYQARAAGASGGDSGGSGGPITTNFLAAPNQFIPVAPPSLGITGTLPKAQLDNAGKRITVKVQGGAIGQVSFVTTGGDTIVGRAVLNEGGGPGTPGITQEPSITYISNGVNRWFELRPEVAPRYSPPEKWTRNNIGAATPPTPMSALVSTNFDDILMNRAGRIVGLVVRLTGALGAGSVTVTVRRNGVAGTLSATIGIGGTFAVASQLGPDFYVAGDLLSLEFSTAAGTAPVTTDMEAWILVEDTPQ